MTSDRRLGTATMTITIPVTSANANAVRGLATSLTTSLDVKGILAYLSVMAVHTSDCPASYPHDEGLCTCLADDIARRGTPR